MARMTNVRILGCNPYQQEEFQALLNFMLEKSAVDELLSEDWICSKASRGNEYHFVMHSDTSLAYAAVPDAYGKFDVIELMKCDVCGDCELDSEVTEDDPSGKQCCNSCRYRRQRRHNLKPIDWRRMDEILRGGI